MKARGMAVILSIFVIGSLIISKTACGDQSSKIAGKWFIVKATTKQGVSPGIPAGVIAVEFFTDKTYFIEFVRVGGKWTILEDGRIKMEHSYGQVNFAILQGDTLFLDYGKDIKLTCKRQDIRNERELIYATWQTNYIVGQSKMTENITFNKDNSYIHRIIIANINDDQMKHNFKFIDDNHIETETGITFTIKKLSRDELVMYRDDKKKDVVYRRISP
jgi:hypothetical protein